MKITATGPERRALSGSAPPASRAPELSAAPAGLTARARPEARPERRAANLRSGATGPRTGHLDQQMRCTAIPTGQPGPARKSGRGMFERFTDRTRRVVISEPASTLGVIVPEQLAVKTLLRAVVRQIPLDLVHFRIRRVLDRRRVLVDLAVIAQLVPNRQPLPVR